MRRSLAMLAMIEVAAAQPPGLPLSPVAPWAVEYATNMCVLSRSFGGTAEAPDATLAIRPLPVSENVEFVLATPSRSSFSPHGQAVLTLSPSGRQERVGFDRWRSSTSNRLLASYNVTSDFLAAMRAADAIDIAEERHPPTRLLTGHLAKPLAAVVPCQDDLLRSWGYDPAVKERIGTPASIKGGTLGAYFGRNSYPEGALRQHHEGRATVAWTIDVQGQPKDCRVLTSSGVRGTRRGDLLGDLAESAIRSGARQERQADGDVSGRERPLVVLRLTVAVGGKGGSAERRVRHP